MKADEAKRKIQRLQRRLGPAGGETAIKFESAVFRPEVQASPDTQHAIAAAVSTAVSHPDAATGRRVRDGGKQGADIANAHWRTKHHIWQELANDIWSRNPQRTKVAVARRIAEATGDRVHTVRQRIMRPEKT